MCFFLNPGKWLHAFVEILYHLYPRKYVVTNTLLHFNPCKQPQVKFRHSAALKFDLVSISG